MTLGTAVLLLALAVAGIVLVLVGYIGLTLILVDAARNRPPA